MVLQLQSGRVEAGKFVSARPFQPRRLPQAFSRTHSATSEHFRLVLELDIAGDYHKTGL
jgi:hypothetical protein